MEKIEWKIFYDDGSTYNNLDGSVENAPTLGVQVIAIEDEDLGRLLLHRNDYYWYDGLWYGGDIFGLWDYLQQDGWKKVLFGRTIGNEKFRSIMKRAEEDSDLPPKSAWTDKERR